MVVCTCYYDSNCTISSSSFLPSPPPPPPPRPLRQTPRLITEATIWLRVIDRLNRACIQISNGVWVCVWGAAQEETTATTARFPAFSRPFPLGGVQGSPVSIAQRRHLQPRRHVPLTPQRSFASALFQKTSTKYQLPERQMRNGCREERLAAKFDVAEEYEK